MSQAGIQRGASSAELRRSVGFWGIMGQSISGIAPTTTPTINIALVFAVVGGASWLAYALAMVAMLLIALNLAPMARTFSAAGSLSEFVGQGLGPLGRLVTAWALLLAYLAVSVATLAACTGYLLTLFGWLHVNLPLIIWVALAGGLAAVFAWRDIRLSTGVMLGLESFSVLLVILMGFAILFHQGEQMDFAEFHLKGLTMDGLNSALLIGILSFVGFEAAATLGDEARNPLKHIPRALILSPLITGAFFIFSAYVISLGFHAYSIPVATSSAPLDDLARALHRPGLGVLVALGAAVSLFGCVIATMVAASRIAFSLAEQGALPQSLARVSGHQAAPRFAVALCVTIILAMALTLASFAKPLDIYDWFGTFGTFGCIAAYALTCVATPVFLRRAGRLKWYHVMLSALALAVLAIVIYGSLIPMPPAPLNCLPGLFVGLLAIGTAGSLIYRRRVY